MEAIKTAIDIVKASQMSKTELIHFLFEDEADKIEADFPSNLWLCNAPKTKKEGKFHYPTHAKDTRDGKIINLIEYGKKICLIE